MLTSLMACSDSWPDHLVATFQPAKVDHVARQSLTQRRCPRSPGLLPSAGYTADPLVPICRVGLHKFGTVGIPRSDAVSDMSSRHSTQLEVGGGSNKASSAALGA